MDQNRMVSQGRSDDAGPDRAVRVIMGLLDDMEMPAYVADGAKLLRVNNAFARLVGRTQDELVAEGFDSRELWAKDAIPTLEQRLAQIRDGNAPPRRFVARLLTRDGEAVPVEAASTEIPYAGATCRFGIMRDLRPQQARAAAYRVLARSERSSAMGSLAEGLAHEIRTPLTAIQTSVHVLQTRLDRARESHLALDEAISLTETVIEEVARAEQALRALNRFTSDAGTRRRGSLQRLTADAIGTFLASTSVRVPIEIALEPTPDVWMDDAQLKQVALQLLRNAVEASESEGKAVHARTTVRPGIPGRACLIVSDEGPGIPEDVQARMYDPLYTTREGHQGLGLAIVRRIVEAHGGEIACQSREGEGAAFTVCLPVAEPEGATA